jgi:methionine sulfoxide reductase catalytic subunit
MGSTSYYEFSADKDAVAGLATHFSTGNWRVRISGRVKAPLTLDGAGLRAHHIPRERVYRLRCAEGWSMVIPWTGFPLARLLALAGPAADATCVRVIARDMITRDVVSGYQWACTDAALQDLTLMVTGQQGPTQSDQPGVPLRLLAPWYYDCAGARDTIACNGITVEFIAEQSRAFWTIAGPFAGGAPEMPQTGHSRMLPFNGVAAGTSNT